MNTAVDFDPRLHQIITSHLAEIPDFPQPGVLFRDFSPLLASGDPFRELIVGIAQHYRGRINAVAGLESRGFILSSPLAVELGVPMIMVRKAGKLPGHVISESYDLEYGSATIQVQPETVHGWYCRRVRETVGKSRGTCQRDLGIDGAESDERTQALGQYPIPLSR